MKYVYDAETIVALVIGLLLIVVIVKMFLLPGKRP